MGEPIDPDVVAGQAAAAHPPAYWRDWVARFELLADPTRLSLLVAVHAAPGSTVGGLASAVGMTPNAATQALGVLRQAGVVKSEPDGRYRRWSLTDDALHELLHHISAPHTPLHRH